MRLTLRATDSMRGAADEMLIREAVRTAESASAVIVLAGLPDAFESEGFDRESLEMPAGHNRLIEELSKTGRKVIVCLSNGAPVAMPWIDGVSAAVECYLGGQAGAGALADILTGKTCPSGKLAETFPLKLGDNPSSAWFPGGPRTVEYREGIYVGYRYYDGAGVPVLFPFGHGLSYTSFSYGGLSLSRGTLEVSDPASEEEAVTASFRLTNTGGAHRRRSMPALCQSPGTDGSQTGERAQEF